jgi:crotonobetainyl-CoA:carnitine CoA-transferase CaiB-like acyl-CoA transferase
MVDDPSAGPITWLHGLRVIDFTHVLAGPYCTRLLADLGAEVIKIEPPKGELARALPHVVSVGHSGYYIQQNAGKKSLCLDLRHPRGREIVERLIVTADVLVENFTPGVIARLGFGYEKLRPSNPRLVMCSISGFGQWGPYRDLKAFATIAAAVTGLYSTMVPPEYQGPPPINAWPDTNAGAHASVAILAALRRRDETGKGCYIDLSLTDAMLAILDTQIQQYTVSQGAVVPDYRRDVLRAIVPGFIYPTPHGPIIINPGADEFWRGICRVIGRDDLAVDPRFATRDLRGRNREALDSILIDWLASLSSREEAVTRLSEAGVPVAPVLNVPETVSHPHIRARGMITKVADRMLGDVEITNTPFHSSDGRSGPQGHAPTLGEHNREILAKLLAYTDSQIVELERAGVLHASE